ncbi:MAG: type II toxin-antitoxin system VapC family toxin [Polyangiaceae bacterium]
MSALDTNVLVRFLVEDDASQSAAAKRILKAASDAGEMLFVSDVVLIEITWVLSRSYRVGRQGIHDVVGRLLQARQLSFRNRAVLLQALERYEKGKGDFADYVVFELAKEAGHDNLLTFDQALLREAGFLKP